MQSTVAIDLGASKAVLAALRRGEPQLIAGRDGGPLVPTALAVTAPGVLVHGHAAEAAGPQAARAFVSRLGQAAALPFNGLEYTPGELAALLLAELRDDAAAALGRPVGRAVLAAPLSCGQRQLAALRDAARRAGLLVPGIVPSPIAAALAYGHNHPEAPPQTLLVVDFGAASLGVAVLRTFPGALTVLAQAGETWLGGEDLTQSIVARLVQGLQRRRGVLIDESQAARQALRWHLRQAAEQAKVALTIVEEAGLVLAPEQLGVPAAIDVALTRAQFEALVRPRLEEALTVVEQALAAARLAGSEVDAVLLAGGSSQVPLWQALLLARLRRARLLRDFNPLTGVALGAALWAGMLGEVHCPACGLAQPFEAAACPRCGRPLSGEPRLACPRCFVPNDARRSGCVKCGTSLRAARQAGNLARVRNPRTTRGPSGLRCSRCGLVAPIGATVCAACGEAIAPFVGALSRSSLGIEGEGGRIDAILPRGRPLPTPEPAHRTLVAAGPLLELAIYEGDKPFACQNERCAVLHVALPEGVPLAGRVDVALGLDRDGLLSAQARLAGDRGHELDAWLEWE